MIPLPIGIFLFCLAIVAFLKKNGHWDFFHHWNLYAIFWPFFVYANFLAFILAIEILLIVLTIDIFSSHGELYEWLYHRGRGINRGRSGGAGGGG